MTDGYGNPSEVINEARTAANLQTAINSNITARFHRVSAYANCPALAYQPCSEFSPDYVKTRVSALNDAVAWYDPAFSNEGEYGLTNNGTAGGALNASYPTPGTSPKLLTYSGETYLWTSGTNGNNASMANSVPLQITGAIEIVGRWRGNTRPSATNYLVIKGTAYADREYSVVLTTTGALGLWCRDSLLASKDTTSGASVTAGNDVGFWWRITCDPAGGTVTYYTAADSSTEPTTWTQLGTPQAAGVFGGNTFASSTGGLLIGIVEGKFYRLAIRSGTAPNTVAAADIYFTAGLISAQTTSFVESSANAATVTINRSTAGRKTEVVNRPGLLFGVDDYLEVRDHPALDITADKSFTVLMMVRQWNTPLATGRFVSKRDTNLPNTGWELATTGATFSIAAAADDGPDGISSTVTITAGATSSIGFVLNRSTATFNAILNGATTAGVSAANVQDTSNALPMRIGRMANTTAYQEFVLYGLAIWNRALSAVEIAEWHNYYSATPPAYNEGGAVLWSLMDTDITNAPWYASDNTASQEAYGFYIEEWTGLDGVHHSRALAPVANRRGGGFIGPQTSSARTMAFNVILTGSSERGLNHLFRWLETTLLDSCSCDKPSLWFREYCPSTSSLTDGLGKMERVALISGPQWEAPPIEDAGCFVRRASFVLASESPCMFRDVVTGTSGTTQQAAVNAAASSSTPPAYVTTRSPFVGTSAQYLISVNAPSYGVTCPYVTISAPLQGVRTFVDYDTNTPVPNEIWDWTPLLIPELRIVAYANPDNATSTELDRMYPIGAMVLSEYRSGYASGLFSGQEIRINFAARTIERRALGGDSETWEDASNMIGLPPYSYPHIFGSNAGLKRWFGTDNCDQAVFVVEPNIYLSDGLNDLSASYVSQWSVNLDLITRFGCV